MINILKKTEKKLGIEELVLSQEPEDRYILDDENAIIVIYNDENYPHNGYVMIHERLVNDKLVEINRWPLRSYYFGSIHKASSIKDLNLFQVQNGRGNYNAIYNYKEGKFIVPQNTWKSVISYPYLERCNGFLAFFEIRSDYEEDDTYIYFNPITGEKIKDSFIVRDDYYYAILDIDGSIRDNKLFKGRSLSEITKIIDLDKYESLDAFKEERTQICNDIKQKKKKEYYQSLESRQHLASAVAKVLNLKK